MQIDQVAQLNNWGIEEERRGNIELAIVYYEANITECYPATHSYERLMILYRQRREYSKEVRVIEYAIKVFTLENDKRLKSAIANPLNKEYLLDIQSGMETCEMVRDKEGQVIFNPYPVLKYILRLAEASRLAHDKP